MELQILKEKDVPLLERKRVSVKAEFHGKATPSKNNLRKEVAKKLKVKEDLVAIRHVYQKFGANWAKIIVHVYKDVNNLKSLEGEKALLKKEEPKAEAKPAEAPKEEAKPEEKKEEAPKEEGKE